MLNSLTAEGTVEDTYFINRLERERRVDEILNSDTDPIAKVRNIMKLGVDEEEAEDLVSQRQLGMVMPVYYERLDISDED